MTALNGWRVLVPRPPGRTSSLVTLLEAQGAVPQAVPLISVEPPLDGGSLDLAVLGLAGGDYDWVGFTSVNAVDAVFDRARELDLSPAVPADVRVAAVGPATATALRAVGSPVDLVPVGGGSAAALAGVWPAARPGESVLLPQSEIAGRVLRDSLVDKGYAVSAVTAYRTVTTPPPGAVAADLASGAYQAVLFTSPSTVRALAGIPVSPGTVLGAIGASTATALADAGLQTSFIATDPTDAALVAGLVDVATRSS